MRGMRTEHDVKGAAYDVYGNWPDVEKWMSTPNAALDGKRPYDDLERAYILLKQIDDGVYS